VFQEKIDAIEDAAQRLVLQFRMSAPFVVTDGGRGLMSSSP
jgi:hypothetical protein